MISIFRELVCEVYGITTDEFNSRSKLRHIVEARALFYKLCIDAGIGNKEAVMFMGRSIQSTRTYQEILAGRVSEAFKEKYAVCRPMFWMVVRRYKNPSTVHPITRYTKAEELMMLKAIMGAIRFMRRYCATTV